VLFSSHREGISLQNTVKDIKVKNSKAEFNFGRYVKTDRNGGGGYKAARKKVGNFSVWEGCF